LIAQLNQQRLPPEAPAETYSTPRRLTVRIARLAERQSDLEELITGPPVSAAFKPDGTPTPAAAGFAAKNGTDVGSLEQVQTAKGTYLAFRLKQRGKTAVDVLPDVLGGTLRGLSFPKFMHWDAMLEDGKGHLPFGRPIRWLLFTYGGRVVPFTVARTPGAAGGLVQDVSTGAATYGHRFLTTSGRAGRAIKVRSFDEYKTKLLENFVILERGERQNKIARELDVKAQRLQGRVSRSVRAESALLQEVPDLVEYPSVIAGTFAHEFLELPEEVLTTTLIHHQHYFPVEGEDGKLKNAFLAVTNTDPGNEKVIARNAERVVTARLRDARFFYASDRKTTLESRLERLDTLLFHKKLGSYRAKTERIETLARTIAGQYLKLPPASVEHAALAARLSKVDLTTDMVREFTELQGKMGGIYAREEGLPEEVSKAIYYQYLPLGVEVDAPPTAAQLGRASSTWVAVSLADKLDTIAGLFAAGERPTGSRDPYGLRRAAQGVVKILVDLPEHIDLASVVIDAFALHHAQPDAAVTEFLWERAAHLFERRGARADEIRVVAARGTSWSELVDTHRRLDGVAKARGSERFLALASLFKRVKNITKGVEDRGRDLHDIRAALCEPAELALVDAMIARWPALEAALTLGHYGEAVQTLADLQPAVDQFFKDVLVMADDVSLREARLALLARLRSAVLNRIGDISELAVDEARA
ncbi:MAG: glycine--tRNA ligase subunit beta, partial [Vicinamibacterales bacterium]